MPRRKVRRYRNNDTSAIDHWLLYLRDLTGRARRAPLKHSGIQFATVILALLTISLIVNFGSQVLRSAELEEQRAALQQEVDQLSAENDELTARAAFFESRVYAELIARDQLGYAREGDTVLLTQITRPPDEAAADPPTPLPQPAPLPNWHRWWDAFFAPTNTL